MAEMKAKYRKEKQTDTSAPLAMSISLALLPDARPADWAWKSGVIVTSQYAEHIYGHSHFPGPEKKKHH